MSASVARLLTFSTNEMKTPSRPQVRAAFSDASRKAADAGTASASLVQAAAN